MNPPRSMRSLCEPWAQIPNPTNHTADAARITKAVISDAMIR